MNNATSLELFEQALTQKGGVALHCSDVSPLKALRWRLYTIRRHERNLDRKIYQKSIGSSRFDELVISIQPSEHGWTMRIYKESEMLDQPQIKIEFGAGTRLC